MKKEKTTKKDTIKKKPIRKVVKRASKKPTKKQFELQISKLMLANEAIRLEKEDLQKRINDALLIVDRDDDFKNIYFEDIQVWFLIGKDYAILRTMFHQHVWNKFNTNGMSLPFAYINEFVKITLEHLDEIKALNKENETYYSFAKLKNLKSLNENEKSFIFNIQRFIYVANDGIYTIGSDPIVLTNQRLQFLTFLAKANIFRNQIEEDMFLNDFYNKFIVEFRRLSWTANLDEKYNDEFNKKIIKLETDVYNQLKTFIKEKDGEILDIIALPKDNNENNALKN